MGIKELVRRYLPKSALKVVRTVRRKREYRNYCSRVVEHSYHGQTLKLLISDKTAERWYDHEWPLLPELVILNERGLGAGSTVFEVGAHHGLVAIILSRLVGQGGRVVALEAVPRNSAIAVQNVRLNSANNVEIINAAGSDSDGVVEVIMQSNGGLLNTSDAVPTVSVSSITLDHLMDQYGCPDVLFIDVEGAELQVLNGARRMLVQRPHAFVEVHVGCGLEAFGGTAKDVAESFPEDQYELLVSAGPGFEREDCSEYRFFPYETGSTILEDRHFLLALRRP